MTYRKPKWWQKLRKHPSHPLVKAEHGVHLTYFLIVALSGPYDIAAGACLAFGITLIVFGGDDK